MMALLRSRHILSAPTRCLYIDERLQVLVYERGGMIFALNFSPNRAYDGYWLTAPSSGKYRVVLSTDEGRFGGEDRISTEYVYAAKKQKEGGYKFQIYLPPRTALCMKRTR